jgi:hypothetical protein
VFGRENVSIKFVDASKMKPETEMILEKIYSWYLRIA